LLADGESPRPIESVADLAIAERWIEKARLMLELVPSNDRPAAIVEGATLPSFFCSDVINRWLGRERFEPFSSADLGALREQLSAGFPQELQSLARKTLEDRLARDLLEPGSALVASWFAKLRDDLVAITDQTVDPRYVDGLLLARTKPTS
jgi:hypothetical protein